MSTAQLSHGLPSTLQGREPQGRTPSGSVYDNFDPKQVQQYKEAFSMIDQDGDGIITEKDLREMHASLGQAPSQEVISTFLERSFSDPPSINFTLFLTLMSEKLVRLTRSEELVSAFACFDEDDSGYVDIEMLRHWLGQVGDRMTVDELDKFLLSKPFADRKGRFNYREFVASLGMSGPEQEKSSK